MEKQFLVKKVAEVLCDKAGMGISGENLATLICSETGISSSGHPFVSESAFKKFVETMPHLFSEGWQLLQGLGVLDTALENLDTQFSASEKANIKRAMDVFRQVTFTANICAPTDLWVVRHVLANWQEIALDKKKLLLPFQVRDLAQTLGVKAEQLEIDVRFLYSRGLLNRLGDGVTYEKTEKLQKILESLHQLPQILRRNVVPLLVKLLRGEEDDGMVQELRRDFFRLPVKSEEKVDWQLTLFELELGFRLVPLVLALKQTLTGKELNTSTSLRELFPKTNANLIHTLNLAGYVDKAGKINDLGLRVLTRGPGPIGIIYAYYPYFAEAKLLYVDSSQKAWVSRAANVDASQKANAKGFAAALEKLRSFCQKTAFSYSVFIEHAVGKGEATRQHWDAHLGMGVPGCHYFGADLEEAAVNEAKKVQRQGLLPSNMKFLAHADIGKPDILVDFLQANGVDRSSPKVMVVGNGFHEIRHQNDTHMIEVFRAYHDFNILLIFIEESALSDDDILNTAWNTYHGGFRYVHEISGQGLRPVYDDEFGFPGRMSWRSLVERAGYQVLDDYSVKTRTIYPFPRENGKNPFISMTYFCLPKTFYHLMHPKKSDL